jgi:hypothetical protein
VLVVANSNFGQSFSGLILVDRDLNRQRRDMTVAYSNVGTSGEREVQIVDEARFWENGQMVGAGRTAAVSVELAPMEIQLLAPV